MRRQRARLVFGVGAALLVLALGSSAGATALPGGSANESFQAWFVQFKTAPAAKGGSATALAAERAGFFEHAVEQGLVVKQRHAFEQLWNGVSVDVSADQAGALVTLRGVEAVYPVVPVALPPTDSGGTSDPDLRYATTMTGADVAQNELELDGSGVKVAVMDSGLDYTLPEFGACASIGPSCRVAGGHDFVGDDFNANPPDSTYQPIPHPDDDPAPCDPNVADQRAGASAAAHGTHVAGIVGADGRSDPDNLVTGVAPGATLYAYRVFGCNGSTSSDVMLAAMERAWRIDGVDVLNMSIGSALNNFPNYPTAVAADNLVDKGVVVVASIGNSGELGLFSAGAPGVADKVIGVAAVDNIKTFLPYFTISADARHVGYSAAAGAPDSPTSGISALAPTGAKEAANGACTGSPISDVAGKVALIRRGGCPFFEKAKNAQDAGAIGVVLYNNAAGRVNATVVGAAPITIPVVSITRADGETMWDRLAAGPATLTWTDQSEFVDNTDTPGRASSFSSWGAASDLTLKPDVAAPGGNIRSTWPHQQHDGHWVISGTSMAAPHVAGAVALYLEAHPGASPATVRTALQNSADPIRFLTTMFADSTARQGAGLLDVVGAVQATTVVSPARISFGEGLVRSATLTITNNGTDSKTYNVSSVPAVTPAPSGTTQYPFTFGSILGPTATFGVTSVTVGPGGSSTVTATVNATALPEKALYGGYVVLTPTDGGAALRVPYLGFRGDYQAIQAMGNAGCAMPMLARFGSASDKIQCATPARTIDGLIGQPSGGTWTQPKKDPMIVLYHFDHQATNVTLTLVNAATGQPMTQGNRSAILQSVDLHPRNSAATAFFAFVWDGTQAMSQGGSTSRKATPGGTYKLKITLTKVKALNDNRAAGTETWTSPTITLRDG